MYLRNWNMFCRVVFLGTRIWFFWSLVLLSVLGILAAYTTMLVVSNVSHSLTPFSSSLVRCSCPQYGSQLVLGALRSPSAEFGFTSAPRILGRRDRLVGGGKICAVRRYIFLLWPFEKEARHPFSLPLFHGLFSGSLSIVILDAHTFTWQYFYTFNYSFHSSSPKNQSFWALQII